MYISFTLLVKNSLFTKSTDDCHKKTRVYISGTQN